jgi:hypothetical protein
LPDLWKDDEKDSDREKQFRVHDSDDDDQEADVECLGRFLGAAQEEEIGQSPRCNSRKWKCTNTA